MVTPQNKPQGGSYKDVRDANEGGQVHHMPSFAASQSAGVLSKNSGPSLWMETSDHRRTQSFRRSREADDYRNQQKELIEQGKFQEAQQMDIDDIRSKFGDKYDLGIQELQNYTQELGDQILPITPDRTDR